MQKSLKNKKLILRLGVEFGPDFVVELEIEVDLTELVDVLAFAG